jgi:hypothetical protein
MGSVFPSPQIFGGKKKIRIEEEKDIYQILIIII